MLKKLIGGAELSTPPLPTPAANQASKTLNLDALDIDGINLDCDGTLAGNAPLH